MLIIPRYLKKRNYKSLKKGDEEIAQFSSLFFAIIFHFLSITTTSRSPQNDDDEDEEFILLNIKSSSYLERR